MHKVYLVAMDKILKMATFTKSLHCVETRKGIKTNCIKIPFFMDVWRDPTVPYHAVKTLLKSYKLSRIPYNIQNITKVYSFA